MSHTPYRHSLATILVAGLAGCGGAPSDGEIHTALTRQIEQTRPKCRSLRVPLPAC